jgi:Uma2 family endonuclease
MRNQAMAVKAHTHGMTAEEFDQFAALPENAERLLEFIAGEVYEVPSNPFASMISILISAALLSFVRPRDLGYVTGEAGGYWVAGERYAPDVAFIAKARMPQLATEGYNPVAPDLAVEIDFPSTVQSADRLRIKIANYLAAGTVVWVVRPHAQRVEVYVPGQPVRILGIDDRLDGGAVLPGFSLPVRDFLQT